MPEKRFPGAASSVSALALLGFLLAAATAPTQERASPREKSPALSDQQVRGEGIFFQRCSICHLAQVLRHLPNAKPFGPSLTALLRDAGAAKEKAVREIILKGGPRMPGFQYGLTPAEIEDLMAYLKTL